MQKITGWSVVRQSVALMWRRRLAVLGFLVVQIILGMAYGVLGLNDPQVVRDNLDIVNMAGFVAGSLLFGLVGAALFLFYTHYMITALRGEPVLVPVRPVRRLLRMVWTGIKIGLVLLLFMGAASLPIIALAVSMPGLKDVPAAVFGVGVGGFVLMFFLFTLLLRLDLALPGVVAGDGTTLRQAWRLSRGRGWRLFTSFIWLVLISLVVGFVVGFVVGVPFILLADEPQSESFPMIMAVSNAIPTLLMSTLFCVWYVRLSDGDSGGDVAAGPVEPEQPAPRVEHLAEKVGGEYYAGGSRD